MTTTNALALPLSATKPSADTIYFLAGFTTDPTTGEQTQTTCAQLTPDHVDTIRRALSFHLDYCEDTAAELAETCGDFAADVWTEAAHQDRAALRGLQLKRCEYTERTAPSYEDTETEAPEEAGETFARRLDRWTTNVAAIVLVLILFIIWDQTHR